MQDCKSFSKNGIKFVFIITVIFSQFFHFVHAQSGIHEGVELSLIYPESVKAGEQFHIYASVFNGSSDTLVYPTITHSNWTENGYTYRSCIRECQGQINIEPGETRVMPAGIFTTVRTIYNRHN